MGFEPGTDTQSGHDETGTAGALSSCLRRLWHKDPVCFAFWSGGIFVAAIAAMSLILEYSYRPKSCILCHEMKPAHETWERSFHGSLTGSKEDCLACHTAPGFGGKIKAKLGGLVFLWNHVTDSYDGDIKAEKPVYCVRQGCHTDPWTMDRGSSIRVNHALHISKGYACVVCHDRIAHGLDPEGKNLPTMKDFCFPCHNDEIASRSQCEYCHIYQEAMLRGNIGGGIPAGEASPHQRARLACVDCHTDGCVPRPVETCLDCHDAPYLSREEQERTTITRTLKMLEDRLPALAEGIRRAEDMGQDISQINGIYTLARDVHLFVKADGSRGAHNPVYSRMLLENAANRVSFALLVIDRIPNITL